ncbi:SH3 domain-containing protein [Frankliniella fusca]|uniref:SH3 domain-containing protein n=1 Tax=Frankliniella fusca TaxID=407009 RepID=A0AAE1GZ81_9NEOP|nr:SH3 domain-containing protein [Frankliniella fusca]
MDVGCPSDVQWDALINYIAPDPEMLNGAMTNPNGKARLNRKWESLSYIVNAADPESAQKTGKGWKNAWNGLKGRARKSYRDRVLLTWVQGMPLPDPYKVDGMSENYRRVVQLTGVQAAMASVKIPQKSQDPDDPAQVDQSPEAAVAPPVPAEAVAPPVPAVAVVPPLPAVAVVPPVPAVAVVAVAPPVPAEAVAPPVPFVGEASLIPLHSISHDLSNEWASFIELDQWKDDTIVIDDDNDVLVGAAPPLVPKPEIKQEEFAASDGEENEVILISDTPIKSIVTHTPPRESGLTPSFKRNRYGEGAIPRQPHADNAGASAALIVKQELSVENDLMNDTPIRQMACRRRLNREVAEAASESVLQKTIRENTQAMKELLQAIRSLTTK